MLGIYRLRNMEWYDWFAAWFELLEYLFNVLTFGCWDLDLSGTWYHLPKPTFTWQRYYGVGDRIKWWITHWIRVLELLLVILTLCYLRFFWAVAFESFIHKHFHKRK